MGKTNLKLKKLIETKPIIRIGGAYDAMSAKLVEIKKFDAIWAGSFAISATHGLPDASIMTMTEFLGIAANMVESCSIPIIADCDTGFGGPSNVSHLVKKYENSGVSAISIEDKIFPKQNSLLEEGSHEIISEKDFVAKLIAAKEARTDPDFLIIARIEALIAGKGMQEAIKRASAYEKAGADIILIHSKQKTPDEIFEFCDSWTGSLPIFIVPTSYPSIKISDLIEHDIKGIIYANQSLRAAHLAMEKILDELIKNESIEQVKTEMSSMEKIFELQEMYKIKKQEESIQNNLRKMGYIS